MPFSEPDSGKQLAKSPQGLAVLLSTIDTQVANATSRITSRCKTVVLGIRRRATEAINITNTTNTVDTTNATNITNFTNTTSTEILSEVD
ncbi:hypothetical protein KI688_012339 [Linnemannia hyalina]|uniref:Uncharacterized protein n=1 Tax=Linnemannia hyalina TaxID=64524 RepID=A0A9P8BTD4_9FUNG|nr:hypothetical protein KI688_012339 [Linnemannia hyalina]